MPGPLWRSRWHQGDPRGQCQGARPPTKGHDSQRPECSNMREAPSQLKARVAGPGLAESLRSHRRPGKERQAIGLAKETSVWDEAPQDLGARSAAAQSAGEVIPPNGQGPKPQASSLRTTPCHPHDTSSLKPPARKLRWEAARKNGSCCRRDLTSGTTPAEVSCRAGTS